MAVTFLSLKTCGHFKIGAVERNGHLGVVSFLGPPDKLLHFNRAVEQQNVCTTEYRLTESSREAVSFMLSIFPFRLNTSPSLFIRFVAAQIHPYAF